MRARIWIFTWIKVPHSAGFLNHQQYRFFSRFLLIRIGFRAMPCRNTFRATNISPPKGIFEDDFPLPKVGYVSSLEGNPWILISEWTVNEGQRLFFPFYLTQACWQRNLYLRDISFFFLKDYVGEKVLFYMVYNSTICISFKMYSIIPCFVLDTAI